MSTINLSDTNKRRAKLGGTLAGIAIGLYAGYKIYQQLTRISISKIQVFPVKSCAGFSCKEWPVTNMGLLCDRNWMIYRSNCARLSQILEDQNICPQDEKVDESQKKIKSRKRFVTQRENSRLALISADVKLNDNKDNWVSLTLSAPESEPFTILNNSNNNHNHSNNKGSKVENIRMFVQDISGYDEGDQVSSWLTKILSKKNGEEYRLVRIDNQNIHRKMITTPMFPDNIKERNVTFVDLSPLSVVSQGTLDDISKKAKVNDCDKRFRMNIIVENKMNQAYMEDKWGIIQISNKMKLFLQPAFRCIIPSVNPITSQRHAEPVRTLRKLRTNKQLKRFGEITEKDWDMFKNKYYVGMHAVNQPISGASNMLCVGDQIKVLKPL